ncbi:inositol monophosphatase family protein [Thiomonas sp. FB-6]|uniref:inositol monophosphatase family protein n=1 Tax=Thiomonas sp. FB-6 TaxID=1158291 RepID=UPI000373DB4D|nr:inositol monophosphatase family protein [Thiomonas sp. FB-6]
MPRHLPRPDDLDALGALLREAAREHILPRAAEPRARLKDDGSWVTDADLGMQRHLQARLAEGWPAVPLLGEEMSPEQQSSLMAAEAGAPDGPGLWVLDPLDGTSNFTAGLPAFGPSLAWVQAGRVRLGLVLDVMRDELFDAALGHGARLQGQALRCPPAPRMQRAIACVDFKRLGAPLAASLATRPPYASQRSLGSVALDWCWVAAGRFHLYVHGAQGLWDYAAGCLILAEAGGASQTLQGEAVFENSLRKRSALAAVDPSLLRDWADWVAGAGQG